MGMFGLDQAEAKQGGGNGWLIDAGNYICIIDSAKLGQTKNGDPKIEIKWDIAEGPWAGTNATSQYPPTEHLVLAGKGLGFTKYKLECISRSNPGFDAVAAADAANFDAFIGKYVGLGIGVELKTNGPKSSKAGEDGERNYVYAWYDVPTIRAGVTVDPKGNMTQLVIPPVKDSRKAKPQGATQSTQSATSTASQQEDEIPF